MPPLVSHCQPITPMSLTLLLSLPLPFPIITVHSNSFYAFHHNVGPPPSRLMKHAAECSSTSVSGPSATCALLSREHQSTETPGRRAALWLNPQRLQKEPQGGGGECQLIVLYEFVGNTSPRVVAQRDWLNIIHTKAFWQRCDGFPRHFSGNRGGGRLFRWCTFNRMLLFYLESQTKMW